MVGLVALLLFGGCLAAWWFGDFCLTVLSVLVIYHGWWALRRVLWLYLVGLALGFVV